MTQPFSDDFKHIADSMGINLYQRFTLNEASLFLRCPEAEITTLVRRQRINSLSVVRGQVEFFGYQLLEYVLGQVTEHQIAPATLAASSSGQDDQILRAKEVQAMTGLSRTTLWRYEKDGLFPARLNLGVGAVGWLKSDVVTWMNQRAGS